MRPAIISACSAISLTLVGLAVPIVFPHIYPWVARGMLWAAALFLAIALVLWLWGLARKSDEEPSVVASGGRAVAVGGDNNAAIQTGDSFNQSHSGSGHNIVAETVHFGPTPFQMTEAVMADVANQLGTPRPITFYAVGGEKSQQAVELLAAHLATRGFTFEINWIGVLGPPLDRPIELRASSVYVDASK